MATQFSSYLPYVTQGCLVLLAIGILLYFKGSVTGSKKGAEAEDPDSFEMLCSTTTRSRATAAFTPTATRPRVCNGSQRRSTATAHGGATVLTPTELSRLIRENPDNASQALKAWLRRN